MLKGQFSKPLSALVVIALMCGNAFGSTAHAADQSNSSSSSELTSDGTPLKPASSTSTTAENSSSKATSSVGIPVSIDTNFTETKTALDALLININVHTDSKNMLQKGDKIVVNLDSNVVDYSSLTLNSNIDKYFSSSFDPNSNTVTFTSKVDMNTEGTVTIALSCHAKDADATTTIAANLIDTTGNSHNINVANPTLTVKKDNPGQVVIPGATIYGGVPSWYAVNYPSNGYRNNSIGLLSKDLWGFSYSAPYHFYTVTFATRESTELGKYIGTVITDHDIKPNSLYIQKTDADNQVTDITNSALTSLSNGTLKVHFDDLKQWQIYSITFAVAAPNFTDKTTVASSFSQGSANVTANITGQYTGTSQAGFVPYIDGKDIAFYQNGKFNLLDQLTAGDVEDGTLTNAIKVVDEGGFDISKPGTYLVKYSVTDSDGNIVTYSRNVSVLASTKAGDVTATYVDTDGHKIADDRVLHGNIGDKYTTTQKQVNGYTFKEIHGGATGAFTDTAQTVIYVYTKDHADSSSSDSSNSNNLSSEHNSSSSSNANNQDSSSASSINSNQITASTSSNRPSDSSQSMQSSSKADQSSQKSLLPKTAAEAASWLGIAGVLISGLAGLLVFLKRHAR